MKKYQGLGFLGPSNLFLLFWLFGVILPILPFLAETDGFSLMWPYVFNDKLDSLASALIVYTGVLISFFLGHGIAKKFLSTKRNSSIPVYVRGPSFELRATIVSIIGLLSIATLIHLVGGIDSWLQAGSNRIREFAGLNFIVLLQNGLLAVSLGWFIKITDYPKHFRTSNHRFFLIFSLTVFMLVAFQGAKSTLFAYIFAMLVIWHAKVRRLPLWRLAAIGILLYTLLMIYHLVKQEYLVVGYFVFYDPADGWLVSFIRFLSQQLTGNLMQLQTMTVLADAIPEQLDQQHGKTLAMIFLIWIPSLLYPDKPLTAPGVFTTALWPEKWIAEGTTMPPGLFGELFMNFGLAGAVAGAMIFGAIYGAVYVRAIHRQSQINLGIYAVMAGLLLHYFRGELASVTVLLLSIIMPLTWMLKGRTKIERLNSQRPLPSIMENI